MTKQVELTSVWEGNDNSLLREAIPLYLRDHDQFSSVPTVVLDCNWGKGVFWRDGIPGYMRVIGLDLDPEKRAEVLADNQRLPIKTGSVSVVVYDPPHVTHDWSEWGQSESYGLADSHEGDGSISYLYPAFLREAVRVLRPGGILMAKIADQIHSGRTFFQAFDFVRCIQETESMTPCDLIVKVRKGYRPQPTGRRQLHSRRRHSFWIIARRGRC